MAAHGWWKASRTARSRRILGALLLILLAWAVPAIAITYIYDELGRLVGVVDPAGNTAVYNYDAVGNILSIQNYPSSTVSIIEFTPNSGAVAATVTIYGTGYSTTPSLNTVTFNGITATITSSTATSIVTTVPTGATTGPIAVTTPTGSATSSSNFVVGSTGGVPTITSFTPTIGVAGSSVTITGTNFDPTPTNDKVKFNTFRLAPVTAAASTSLTATVPSAVGSGHLRVEAAGGGVTSSGDFFIPPSPYAAADVQATGRMTYGGASQTITISTAGKLGLVVFDGTAGDGAVLSVSNNTITSSTLSLYKPDGSLFQVWGVCCGVGANTPIPSLPSTGSYTVMVQPDGTYTGSMTLSIGAPDLTLTALTPPATPISPNRDSTYTITMSWTAKNNGPNTANPSWLDAAYLSTDQTLDVNDFQLGTATRSTSLASGSTYTVNPTWTIYGGLPLGTYWVIVKTDAANQMQEKNEANNTKVSATQVTVLGLPDLIVTGITVPTSPVARNGDGTWTVPVTLTIKNQGQSTALPNWYDGTVLNTTPSFNGYIQDLGGGWNFAPVAAGASYMVSYTYTVSGVLPGTYYFIGVTDSGDRLPEANESNNTLPSTAVTLQP